jgi:hypothetical protein
LSRWPATAGTHRASRRRARRCARRRACAGSPPDSAASHRSSVPAGDGERSMIRGCSHRICPRPQRRAGRVDPQADRAVGEGGRHAVAVALEVIRQVGETRLLCSTKPSKAGGKRHQAGPLSAQTSAIVPGRTPCGSRPIARCNAARARHSAPRDRGSWASAATAAAGILDVLLDLTLLPPGAGLQNSGSNR